MIGVFVDDDLDRVELILRHEPDLPAAERDQQSGALARHRGAAGSEQAEDFQVNAAAAGEELDFVADFDAEAFGEELADDGALRVGEGLACDDLVLVDGVVEFGIDGGGDELDGVFLLT